jgi:hypothetical protein
MVKTRELIDPEFGAIQIPPPPKRADAERLLKEQKAAFAGQRL